MEIVLVGETKISKQLEEQLADCSCWNTQKEHYSKARYCVVDGEKVENTMENALKEWGLEDTVANRESIKRVWESDYVDWIRINGQLVEFGQGDYTITTALGNLVMEEINVLEYLCKYRLNIKGSFTWES